MSDSIEAIAIDCEMVGAGPRGSISLVARVSLVNENGACVYDTYVKPTKNVTDYRTPVSGVTAAHLAQGRPFNTVKSDVASLIKGCILVGHSLDKDLRALGLCHPPWSTRDTEHYPPFRTNNGTPSLKYLAQRYLGWSIQNGAHSSVQDAKAAMRIYQKVKQEWEDWLEQSDSESEASVIVIPAPILNANMKNLTGALAMDCLMVGAEGPQGIINLVARVSLVNEHGTCVYDTYVRPTKKVIDYRTAVNGVTPVHLAQGRPYLTMKGEVARFIKGRILVGHTVDKDLRTMGLCHPEGNTRDTADYPPFQKNNGTPTLRSLAKRYLKKNTQIPQCSVENARVTMRLFKKVEQEWQDWLDQSDSESEEQYSDYGAYDNGSETSSDEEEYCMHEWRFSY